MGVIAGKMIQLHQVGDLSSAMFDYQMVYPNYYPNYIPMISQQKPSKVLGSNLILAD
jgi:hypothetical protein